MSILKFIIIFVILFFIVRWGTIGVIGLIKTIGSKRETILSSDGDKRYRKEAFVKLGGWTDIAITVLSAVVAGVISILLYR